MTIDWPLIGVYVAGLITPIVLVLMISFYGEIVSPWMERRILEKESCAYLRALETAPDSIFWRRGDRQTFEDLRTVIASQQARIEQLEISAVVPNANNNKKGGQRL